MTRRAFLQKYFLRFAVVLVLVSLLAYILYHVLGSSESSLMRTPVRRITDEQIVSGDGYLFRDERLLTVSGEGLVNELAESGVKVSSGVPLLEVWSGRDALLLPRAQQQLDSINRAIAILEKSVETGGQAFGAEHYRSHATEAYQLICRAVREDDWSALAAAEESLLVSLNRYAVISGSREELTDALNRLKQARAVLLTGDCLTVKNEGASGYFYGASYVDGYERIFTEEALKELTADGFFALTERSPEVLSGEYAVGKLAHGYDWYLAVSFDAGVSGLLSEGEEYVFRLPENRGRELTMTCERLMTASDGRLVGVFSSTEIPSDMVYLRVQEVEITLATTEGYYIPDSALWELDGVIGVYIFKDSTVYFRRIDVLYRGDGYCIAAEQGERGDDYLAPTDVLITSGRNLYDGKVYR